MNFKNFLCEYQLSQMKRKRKSSQWLIFVQSIKILKILEN